MNNTPHTRIARCAEHVVGPAHVELKDRLKGCRLGDGSRQMDHRIDPLARCATGVDIGHIAHNPTPIGRLEISKP